MSTTAQGIAANVRAELARRRIRQERLAEALDLSQSAISRRVLGERPFLAHELKIVAKLLGVEVADLYAEVPSPSSDEPPAVAS